MKLLKGLFALGLALGVIIAGAMLYVMVMANRVTLPPLKMGDSSQVLASDGQTEIGRISAAGGEHRSLTDEQVSPLIRQAFMSAEDRNFYTHGAISVRGLAKAFYTDATSGSIAAGGSTITQQYVKNAYLSQERTVDRKAKEIIYAYRVENDFTKDQILTKYANSNYYGRGAYGIDDAARVWFGVPATQLRDLDSPKQVARAAFLAAIINLPSYFDDYSGSPSHLVHRDQLEERMLYVLSGMRQVQGVSALVPQRVIDAAKALVPKLKLTNTLKRSGRTASGDPYVVSYVRDWLVAWQTEVAKQDGITDEAQAGARGRSMAESMLARGGMRIVTSINAGLQKRLRDAARSELPGGGLANGDVIMDPRTGAVVAMYGGSARAGEEYNYALYANRQVGSIMKTVVLADVVRSGISVNSVLPAPAYIKVNGSRIYNDDRSAAAGCKLSIADALAKSNNPVAVELITGKLASCRNPAELTDIEENYPVSPKSVANLARRMGADDSLVPGRNNPAKLPEVPSLALGIGSMTPVKVATLGSTLANGGMHVPPHLLEQITAVDGKVVYQNQTTATRVLGEQEAALVNKTLEGVFAHGTAVSNQVAGHPMAGKTGTTPTDAWGLMYSAVADDGKTPAYVCASWAGYPDSRKTPGNLWGTNVMRICEKFLRGALSGQPSVAFAPVSLDSGRYVGLSTDSTQATEQPSPETSSAEPTTEEPASPSPEPTFTESATSSPTETSEEPSPSESSGFDESPGEPTGEETSPDDDDSADIAVTGSPPPDQEVQ